MNAILSLARPEIITLKPYSHAAWMPSLTRLHANEAPWRPAADTTEAGLNRYPEPQPHALIERFSQLYGLPPSNILATRGSDEAIDLLSRIFLRAGRDAILQCAPTFGMYQVAARIQGCDVVEIPLDRACSMSRVYSSRPGAARRSRSCRHRQAAKWSAPAPTRSGR